MNSKYLNKQADADLQAANEAAWAVWNAARDTAAPETWVDGHPYKLEATAALQRTLRANTEAFHATRALARQSAISPVTGGRAGYAPTGTTVADTSGSGCCATCGQGGSYWNPGAGSFLCHRHWDEY